MEHDDQQLGRILSRREALALMGAAGAAVLAACATGQSGTEQPASVPTLAASSVSAQAPSAASTATMPSCIVRPALTEGPYFVDEKLKGYDLTSQLFFDDALTDQVHAQAPYASKGQSTPRNDGDNIFRNGGDQLMLALAEVDQGYAAAFDVGLQLT